MGRRWKILIIVGLTVAALDQWSKFLVIKHLTPGMAAAHRSITPSVSVQEVERIKNDISLGEAIGYFYSSVENPCAGAWARHCPTIPVIRGFWNWHYVENPGAAWGLLANVEDSYRVPFFILISILALIFIILFFRKLHDQQLLLVSALSLVFGGAIGNFIDRLHLSYVIDFVDWYIGKSHWPTFNVADSAISVGVSLLMIEWIRDWKRARAAMRAESPAQTS